MILQLKDMFLVSREEKKGMANVDLCFLQA